MATSLFKCWKNETISVIKIQKNFQLMSEIKFHLTVHTPWRALEGLLIDIKTRFASSDPDAVEALRLDATVKP